MKNLHRLPLLLCVLLLVPLCVAPCLAGQTEVLWAEVVEAEYSEELLEEDRLFSDILPSAQRRQVSGTFSVAAAPAASRSQRPLFLLLHVFLI